MFWIVLFGLAAIVVIVTGTPSVAALVFWSIILAFAAGIALVVVWGTFMGWRATRRENPTTRT